MKATEIMMKKHASFALAAALACSAAMPAAAFAKTSSSDVDDATQVITGLAAGDTVTAYQIVDTDIDSTNSLVYSLISGLPEAYDSVDEIAAADGASVAKAISAAAVKNATKTVQTTSDATGSATLALDSGYWMAIVTSTSGNTVVYQPMLINATPDADGLSYAARTLADAAVKKENVTAPDKKIIAANNASSVATDSYSVGDTAKFEVSAAIPSYPVDAVNRVYKITDTPETGLAIDKSSIVVKGAGAKLSPGTDYVLSDNGNGYVVSFTDSYIKNNPGTAVSVSYSALVESVDKVTGKVGNTVYGTFNPNPYEQATVDTGTSSASAGTYGFTFKKLAADTGNALEGAEFTIKNAAGQAVSYMDVQGVLHNDGIVSSDANGYVYVNGLKEGTYTVSETRVPAGYQKIKDFTVTLSADTATGDSAATDSIVETNFASVSDQTDAKAALLPVTGEMGTFVLVAGGIALIAFGATMMSSSRNRAKKDE